MPAPAARTERGQCGKIGQRAHRHLSGHQRAPRSHVRRTECGERCLQGRRVGGIQLDPDFFLRTFSTGLRVSKVA